MVALEKASNMFRAMGDPSRLRLLYLLVQKEWCVGDLVETLQEKFSTVSQRLRLLRSEGLVRRRRQGTHLYYVIQDRHVADLIHNALAHAKELVEEGSALSETDEGEADTSVTS
jgi:ArsR family transcriptional regulator